MKDNDRDNFEAKFHRIIFVEDHHSVWTDRGKKKKVETSYLEDRMNARDETPALRIIARLDDTRVDFTNDGARRFALTRARNEITPSIEIPARNQSETILDFNPRVTNEPIIT